MINLLSEILSINVLSINWSIDRPDYNTRVNRRLLKEEMITLIILNILIQPRKIISVWIIPIHYHQNCFNGTQLQNLKQCAANTQTARHCQHGFPPTTHTVHNASHSSVLVCSMWQCYALSTSVSKSSKMISHSACVSFLPHKTLETKKSVCRNFFFFFFLHVFMFVLFCCVWGWCWS